MNTSAQTTPIEILENKELDVLITKEIEKLPERCRLVFILNRYFNFKYSEIVEILSVLTKTVDAQMVQAVKKNARV
jgi:DNA-directed RNA polymerase specialized sigma24 family protein